MSYVLYSARNSYERGEMISVERITRAFNEATREFSDSEEYQSLACGHASTEAAHEFIRNVFRTHYLSAHIVALCFAALPSNADELLKENLLEEMGRSEKEKPHSALLVELVRGIGFPENEVDQLITDARKRVAIFCATRVPVATLRELCLSLLLETMSFEFMLSRCSSEIATALTNHYSIPKAALLWFELHYVLKYQYRGKRLHCHFHELLRLALDIFLHFYLIQKKWRLYYIFLK